MDDQPPPEEDAGRTADTTEVLWIAAENAERWREALALLAR